METDFKKLLPLLLLLMLPAVGQAQFSFANNNGTITITGYIGGGGAVAIPGTIAGLPVTSVGDFAFVSCTSVTSVAIPGSVTNIGNQAFQYCTRLNGVTMGNSVTSIGSGAFYACSSLTGITIPGSVTNVGSAAFGLCSSLRAIAVSAPALAYSSVAGVLFDKAETVLVAFPAGDAGGYTIPNSVTNIGDYAFYSCSGLTNVIISGSVTNIGYGAFGLCGGLTEVTLPGDLASLGDYAFANCTHLTNVYFQGNAPVTGASLFAGDDNVTVYYLSATKGWGPIFANRPTAFWDPVVVSQPSSSLSSCPGRSCSFGVLVEGKSPLVYQWRKNGTNLTDTVNCIGPTTAQLILSNLTVLDTARYDVVVTNSGGSTTSSVAALTVGYSPARATPVVVNGFVVGATLIDGGCGYSAPPIIRFAGQTGAAASGYAQISNGSVTNIVITGAGDGFSADAVIQVYPSLYPVLSIESTLTTMPAAEATPVVVNGFIVGAVVTAPGTAYDAPPGVSFSDVSGSGAAAYAQIGNGGITNIVIAMAGSGYSSNATISISAPPDTKAITISASNLVVGQNYELQTATDLTNWAPVGVPFSPLQVSWPLITNAWSAASNASPAFYRLQMVP